jgi:AcrR family transcriptional regulator
MPALDAESVLAATEDVLRRHGPAKASVVDVARALGVSHAAVYRYFPSKAALREAVARRWLTRGQQRLRAVATDPALEPAQRLRGWLAALFADKRARAVDDPELFATFGLLVAEHRGVAAEHVADLVEQLRGLIADGIAAGAFTAGDPAALARAVFDATTAFHHPAHAGEWGVPGTEAALHAVCDVLIGGLRARV